MGRSMLSGIQIKESPLCTNVPRMTLSPKLAKIIGYSRPEFVAETNAWMKEFFGTHDVAYMINLDAVGMIGGELIITSPHMVAMLRNMSR